MFKTIKLWWKIRKLKKALENQVKTEVRKDEEYTQERIKDWLENNEFGLKERHLHTHCVSRVPKNAARNIDKQITIAWAKTH